MSGLFDLEPEYGKKSQESDYGKKAEERQKKPPGTGKS